VRGAYYPVTGLVAHRVKARETLRWATAWPAKPTPRAANGISATIPRRTSCMRRCGISSARTSSRRARLWRQTGCVSISRISPVDPAELTDIEQQVNDHIRQNAAIETDITTLDDALASGALAFFGDRYPEQNVRVVTIPDPASPRGFYSKELCAARTSAARATSVSSRSPWSNRWLRESAASKR